MERNGRYLLAAAGIAAVSTAALLTRRRSSRSLPRVGPEACVSARLVDDAPANAIVVDADDHAVPPTIRDAVRAAIDTDARVEAVDVTVGRESAADVVGAVCERLPYHVGSGTDGVYIRLNGRIVVVNAIGLLPAERAQ